MVIQQRYGKQKKGVIKGGAKFNKNGLLRILKSELYVAQYKFEGRAYPAKHKAIIERDIFDKAQEIIKQNSTDPKTYVTGTTPASLSNISYCGLCDSSLANYSTTKQSSGKKYYYIIINV